LGMLMDSNENTPDERNEDEAEVRATWQAEIRRRIDEITRGKVIGVSAEEVDRLMAEKYG